MATAFAQFSTAYAIAKAVATPPNTRSSFFGSRPLMISPDFRSNTSSLHGNSPKFQPQTSQPNLLRRSSSLRPGRIPCGSHHRSQGFRSCQGRML
ncbi:hypothetical protein BDN72DRAFT_840387 [Pluteus cervinus]|uniref:Uncharacterized protein n=1 Tax=Pluteus cervinus TaxID=181527 RepID=A0ACD3AUJ4_9AGAR|nr:hypothetical protein BDN72DRAFT_840387 [Pluteus cervinus]